MDRCITGVVSMRSTSVPRPSNAPGLVCPIAGRPSHRGQQAQERDDRGAHGGARATAVREDDELLRPALRASAHPQDDVVAVPLGVKHRGLGRVSDPARGALQGEPVGAGNHVHHGVEGELLLTGWLLDPQDGTLSPLVGVDHRDLWADRGVEDVRVERHRHGDRVPAARDQEQLAARVLREAPHGERADAHVPGRELQLVALAQGQPVVAARLVGQRVLHEHRRLHAAHLKR
mmetsp:Transcript_78871/g.223482  ORF Transcript_78871/g.223482 Transcript_78871/m.223482 type:complete len:233 (+) Transcript_78871:160-858(+)